MGEFVAGMIYGLVDENLLYLNRTQVTECLTNTDAAYRDLTKGIEKIDQ